MGVSMRKRNSMGIAFLTTTALTLSACGSTVPEMSEEQNAQIVEYAAGLLLKYDENQHSRLIEETEAEAEGTQEEEARQADAQTEDRQEETAIPQSEEEPELVDNTVDETAVERSRSIEEFYGLEGVEIRYSGFELKDSYPDNDSAPDELYLAMNATSGCKLLVLNFDVVNTSGQEVNLNMVSAGAKFKISLNGEAPRYALTTMLLNDLGSYTGTIAAGETERLVLIGEIPADKADSIQSVSLSMKNAAEDATSILN